MALKCFLRFSTAFAIRDMQIKTSLRLILTPVKMAKIIKKIKKKTMTNSWIWGKGALFPAGGSTDWCSYYGKQCGIFSKS